MIEKFKFKFKYGNKKQEVLIRVYGNSCIKVLGLTSPLDEDGTEMRPTKTVWKQYESYRSNDIVVRSGSGLCGVYPYKRKKGIFKKYIENDTMHSTAVEEIALNIFRAFPLLFTSEEQARIVYLIRYHDLGEKTDKPDDGSTPHDLKFRRELKRFIRKIRFLPVAEQELLISDFIVFENANEKQWDAEQKRLMQFAKLCDKLDGPFGALLYEKQGRKGSLLYKKKHFGGITEQDKCFGDEINCFDQADIWAAHMIDTYREYTLFELFVEFLVEACRDVRGENFPWLYRFCAKRELFDDETLTRICT